MVNSRDFNDLISQVNKKFSQMDAEIQELRKLLEEVTSIKQNKKIDK
jgi:hypothetical protein